MPPTATRNMSLIAIPAIEPATPDRELRSDMVIGMSAPPTLTEKYNPNNAEVNVVATITIVSFPLLNDPIKIRMTVSSRNIIVVIECPGHTIGF